MTVNQMPFGIDVSNHQNTLDWSKLSQQIDFAFMKATESTTFTDGQFSRNWENCLHFGTQRGAYHFARPSRNPDARKEADFFINTVTDLGGPLQPTDMLVLDMEDDDAHGSFGGWTLYWLQIIESYVGFKPILYTAPGYIQSLGLNVPGIDEYGLWLAAPGQTTIPRPPAPWSVVAFHQYSWKGRLNGYNGDLDLNHFNGSKEQMKLYGKLDIETPPTPKIDVAAIEEQLSFMEINLKDVQHKIDNVRNLISPKE